MQQDFFCDEIHLVKTEAISLRESEFPLMTKMITLFLVSFRSRGLRIWNALCFSKLRIEFNKGR